MLTSAVKRSTKSTTSQTTSPSKKSRSLCLSEMTTLRLTTVHPLFTGGLKELGTFIPSPPALVHWLHLDPFAPTEPESSADGAGSKKVSVVFYDLDGTLIKPKTGARFPTSRDDWVWWNPSVPKRLQKEHAEGKHLVVISNQADARPKIRSEWRAKLSLIAGKMPAGVPFRVLAALNKGDIYRKPNIGMYETVERVYREQGYEIDLGSSVFVGDAAGRLGGRGVSKDHSDTDYKFALNVGLKFLTPEEHFFGDPRPPYPIPPNGFHPSKLGSLALFVPSNTPITRSGVEIVLFVGPPLVIQLDEMVTTQIDLSASGKTTFFRKHFAGQYQHVNQDTLKTRDACVKVATDYVSKSQSVVVDNTNRNRETRSHWVSLAAKLNVPIRLFHFLCPIELAKHNNVYRALYAPSDETKRDILPALAFSGYAAQSQEPDMNEGFDEIRGVNFVWKGSDEQRKKWDMWILDK